MSDTYDLVILGSGPAGYVGALRAAQLGASVAVVESRELGGVCLNRGCIPTKTIIETAWALHEGRRAKEMGVEVTVGPVNFERIVQRARGVVDRLRRGIGSLFQAAHVVHVQGRGKLLASDRVLVEDGKEKTELRARAVLLATGTEPAVPGPLKLDSPRVITSDDVLTMKELPRRVLVVGGGVTGCEYAGLFSQLGSEVVVVEMLDRILSVIDEDLRKGLTRSFRRQRIKVHLGTRVEELHENDAGVVAELSQGDPVEADLVLVSVGRRANVEGIGLEEAGVEVEEGYVKVGDGQRTSARSVWAAGDVTGGRWLLAHVASREALVAVEEALGEGPSARPAAVPFGIFTVPEIGAVGMSEAEAEEAGHQVSVGRFPFQALGRALASGHPEGFVKVVADAGTGELLGVHILGPRAADLIHEAALALEMEATVDDLITTMHAHPTFAEAIQEAALDALGRALHLPKRKS